MVQKKMSKRVWWEHGLISVMDQAYCHYDCVPSDSVVTGAISCCCLRVHSDSQSWMWRWSWTMPSLGTTLLRTLVILCLVDESLL